MTLRRMILLALLIVLLGCSGGGGGGGDDDNDDGSNDVVETNHPPTAAFSANPMSGQAPLTVSFDASSSSDSDGDSLSYQWAFGDSTTGSGVAIDHQYNTADNYTVQLTVSDPDGATDSATVAITVTAAPVVDGLPPNPADVAPELDPAVPTPIGDLVSFLYDDDDPIQTDVDPADIDPLHVAVLRGQVNDRNGSPLPGVRISILKHSEYGQTLSRSDGMFDLAVNGGSFLTVVYQKEDYLTVQRPVEAPWRDFAVLPEVVMIPLDAATTAIDFSEPGEVQVAQGTPVSDVRGERQSTLLFPSGTMAQMRFADGSTQSLSQLTVRATEYTTGDSGPQAMPGPLPFGVAYTYAAELSVDEAMEAGAVSIEFNGTVFNYVENFLNFPVGEPVPAYYFDRQIGAWRAMASGVVIEILSETDGLAVVDADGDGTAENEAAMDALEMTAAERQRLATLYEPGQTLWRVPLTHFTPVDYNWPPELPDDAVPPDPPDPTTHSVEESSCEESGSIVECQGQVMGERLPVPGTTYTLNYRSDRAPGHGSAYIVDIPLYRDTLPDSCEEIHLEISVAGRKFEEILTDADMYQLSYRFAWDGLDAYGRKLKGRHQISVRIGYAYAAVYRCSSAGCTADPLLGLDILWFDWKGWIGEYAFSQGLGGWSISPHHTYDPNDGMLLLGTGQRRRAKDVTYEMRYEGGGGGTVPATGVLLTEAVFEYGVMPIVAPDGGLYIMSHSKIFKVGTDGILTHIAGNGGRMCGDPDYDLDPCLDNIPATQTPMGPADIEFGPDGTIYYSDYRSHLVRKISPDGIVTTVAGNGEMTNYYHAGDFYGDGGPAVDAALNMPGDIALGANGSIYIHDSENFRIRKVDPEGIITTVMGTGNKYNDHCEVGYPATDPRIIVSRGTSLGLDNDGLLLVASSTEQCIRRLEADGSLTQWAGTGDLVEGSQEEGIPAIEAELFPRSMAIGPDESVYISDSHRIRRIGPDGIITTIAGTGEQGNTGDNGPALEALIQTSYVLAMGSDQSIYFESFNLLRRIIPTAMPKALGASTVIVSDDGMEMYTFDALGRHLTTYDSRTGVRKYLFAYDDTGWLSSIENADGRIITIERDGSGQPIAIAGPYDQRTKLTLDDNGFLASITNLAEEIWSFTYSDGGLLTSATDPESHQSQYTYNDVGRLLQTRDAAGGGQELARTDYDVGYKVDRTTAEGRLTTYQVDREDDGTVVNTTTGCCGSTTATNSPDGTSSVTFSNGMTRTATSGQDVRFGGQAPVNQALTISTPGGLSLSSSSSHDVALTDPGDKLSVETMTDTLVVNGRTFTRRYDAATHTTEIITPEGRQSVTVMDADGRVVERSHFGMNTLTFTYNDQGRPASMSYGVGSETAQMKYSYDDQGRLSEMLDPLGRTASFQYDTVGRVSVEVMPDGTTKSYTRDANGRLASITLITENTHSFEYNEVGLLSAYHPPNIGLPSESVTFDYDLDKHLTRVTRPDGKSIALAYDNGGSLSSLTIARGTYTYQRAADSGLLQSITTPEGNGLVYSLDGNLLTGLQWTGTVSGRVDWQVNNDFQREEETVNNSQAIAFSYNLDGQIVQAGDLTITRDATSGRITSTSLGNINSDVTLDDLLRTLAFAADYSGSPLYNCTYTYDLIGRMLTRTESIQGESHAYTYGYDQFNRLISVSVSGGSTVNITYDGNGNRLTYTESGNTDPATYDNQDRLLTYADYSYDYSAHGDLARMTGPGVSDVTVYGYDELGNLLSATLPDGTAIQYIIDGANRRVGKRVNGTLVNGWLYINRLRVAAELDDSGTIVSRFVYGDKANVPSYMIRSGNTYRIISDHLGSPRLVVNVDNPGDVAQRMDYDAWGNVLNDTNPGFQPFGFAGGLYDPDTGLVRFGLRDYDARTGRWTTKDPVGFAGGSNLYLYAKGEPVGRTDISGLRDDLEMPSPELPDEDLLAPVASPSRINDMTWQSCARTCNAMWRQQEIRGRRHDQRNWNRNDMRRPRSRDRETDLACALRGEETAGAYDIWMDECVTNVWCAGYDDTFHLTDEEREMEFFEDHPFEYIYNQISDIIRSDDYFEPTTIDVNGGGTRF